MLLAFQFFCAHGSRFDELIRNFESGRTEFYSGSHRYSSTVGAHLST